MSFGLRLSSMQKERCTPDVVQSSRRSAPPCCLQVCLRELAADSSSKQRPARCGPSSWMLTVCCVLRQQPQRQSASPCNLLRDVGAMQESAHDYVAAARKAAWSSLHPSPLPQAPCLREWPARHCILLQKQEGSLHPALLCPAPCLRERPARCRSLLCHLRRPA